MSLGFDTAAAPDVLFRVGRRPEVWRWTDWRFAGPDGTFGCRWDDPQSRYRVAYASATALGAYLEALAPLRPDPHVVAACAEIDENDAEAPQTKKAGVVPASWRAGHLLGRGVCDGVQDPLVAVGGAASLAVLRRELAALLLESGLSDLDAATIRLAVPRRFTQGVSRFIYEQAGDDGTPFAGIFYLSRYGDDVVNCGLFERGDSFPVMSLERSDIAADNAEFLAACRLLEIAAQDA